MSGIRNRAHDLLAGAQAGQVLHILRERLAGHGDAVAVQQPLFKQHLHHGRQAADGLQVFHDVRAAGFEIGQQRGLVADLLEIVNGERHVHRTRHGNQMKHGVGRTTQGCNDHHCVFKSLAGHDVARFQVELEQIQNGSAGAKTFVELQGIFGRRR